MPQFTDSPVHQFWVRRQGHLQANADVKPEGPPVRRPLAGIAADGAPVTLPMPWPLTWSQEETRVARKLLESLSPATRKRAADQLCLADEPRKAQKVAPADGALVADMGDAEAPHETDFQSHDREVEANAEGHKAESSASGQKPLAHVISST